MPAQILLWLREVDESDDSRKAVLPALAASNRQTNRGACVPVACGKIAAEALFLAATASPLGISIHRRPR